MSDDEMVGMMVLLLVGVAVLNFWDFIITAFKWIIILALIAGGTTLLYLQYVKKVDLDKALEEILK